jgi:hypothetical protein
MTLVFAIPPDLTDQTSGVRRYRIRAALARVARQAASRARGKLSADREFAGVVDINSSSQSLAFGNKERPSCIITTPTRTRTRRRFSKRRPLTNPRPSFCRGRGNLPRSEIAASKVHDQLGRIPNQRAVMGRRAREHVVDHDPRGWRQRGRAVASSASAMPGARPRDLSHRPATPARRRQT